MLSHPWTMRTAASLKPTPTINDDDITRSRALHCAPPGKARPSKMSDARMNRTQFADEVEYWSTQGYALADPKAVQLGFSGYHGELKGGSDVAFDTPAEQRVIVGIRTCRSSTPTVHRIRMPPLRYPDASMTIPGYSRHKYDQVLLLRLTCKPTSGRSSQDHCHPGSTSCRSSQDHYPLG